MVYPTEETQTKGHDLSTTVIILNHIKPQKKTYEFILQASSLVTPPSYPHFLSSLLTLQLAGVSMSGHVNGWHRMSQASENGGHWTWWYNGGQFWPYSMTQRHFLKDVIVHHILLYQYIEQWIPWYCLNGNVVDNVDSLDSHVPTIVIIGICCEFPQMGDTPKKFLIYKRNSDENEWCKGVPLWLRKPSYPHYIVWMVEFRMSKDSAPTGFL